jgi:hypothetical protein
LIATGNQVRYTGRDPLTGQVVGTVTGASPISGVDAGLSTFFTDRQLNNFYSAIYDPDTGGYSLGTRNNQLTHVLSYASPETRKQGDFKLSYEWDEAALEIGGGISIENDYESRFGNIGGRFDFNQKRTTLNWGASYTNSDTAAVLDPDGLSFYITDAYEHTSCDSNNGTLLPVGDESRLIPVAATGYIENICGYDPLYRQYNRTSAILHGNRQDWGSHLGLTQVLEAPQAFLRYVQMSVICSIGILGYDRFIEPFNAALHFNYNFAHDDWGINAHTFEGDWVQPLGAGWTVTPRIRYYSQSAADFYTTGIFRCEAGSRVVPRSDRAERFHVRAEGAE